MEFKTKLPEVTLTPQSTDAVFSVELSRSDVEVSWLKNGKPIKTSDKVVIVSEGCLRQLILRKVAMDDQADYTCVAVNVKTSSKLKVESRFFPTKCTTSPLIHFYIISYRVSSQNQHGPGTKGVSS